MKRLDNSNTDNNEEEIYGGPVFTFQAWRSEGCELSSTCLATSLGSLFKAYKPEWLSLVARLLPFPGVNSEQEIKINNSKEVCL
ncbi:Hypothetical predicted protein [Olea europaea subsp. europaea]|nr:Hypothetical predicted protein [Olea europaea subsp. europaea]